MPFPLYKVIIPLQISPSTGWFSTTGKVSVTIHQSKQYLPGTPRQRGPLHRYTAVEYGNRILKNHTSLSQKSTDESKLDVEVKSKHLYIYTIQIRWIKHVAAMWSGFFSSDSGFNLKPFWLVNVVYSYERYFIIYIPVVFWMLWIKSALSRG